MSAPIMYISARLVLISKASDAQYNDVIQNTRRDVTIVALISLVCKYFYREAHSHLLDNLFLFETTLVHTPLEVLSLSIFTLGLVLNDGMVSRVCSYNAHVSPV